MARRRLATTDELNRVAKTPWGRSRRTHGGWARKGASAALGLEWRPPFLLKKEYPIFGGWFAAAGFMSSFFAHISFWRAHMFFFFGFFFVRGPTKTHDLTLSSYQEDPQSDPLFFFWPRGPTVSHLHHVKRTCSQLPSPLPICSPPPPLPCSLLTRGPTKAHDHALSSCSREDPQSSPWVFLFFFFLVKRAHKGPQSHFIFMCKGLTVKSLSIFFYYFF